MVSSLGVALIIALSFSISLSLPTLRASKISFLDRFMHGQEEMIQYLLAADEVAAKVWVDQVCSTPWPSLRWQERVPAAVSPGLGWPDTPVWPQPGSRTLPRSGSERGSGCSDGHS